MFIVYLSNRLEVLADQLAALVRQPTDAPFVPETIIVQSLGMARWLSFRLADHLGVCAHAQFPFPAAFIWDIFHRVLTNVPEASPFAPDVLTWRLMALLGDLEEAPRFAPLRAYCEGGDDVKRYELASRIATVYDQYLVYRPDWIRTWRPAQMTIGRRSCGGGSSLETGRTASTCTSNSSASWRRRRWRGPIYRGGYHSSASRRCLPSTSTSSRVWRSASMCTSSC